ncbi:MAG TPA: TIGR00296 family protein [Methanocella sp.]|nr:TIGR00296 family protein [Methanocella sp.]
MLSLEEGTSAVKMARHVIEEYVKAGVIPKVRLSKAFDHPGGVFVTIHIDHELRGCIGYPSPIEGMTLGEALADAAVSAATRDPRFPRVRTTELGKIRVEVTILTEPVLLKGKATERPRNIMVGRDGLIVELGPYKGLLLPQVPTEWGWNATEFLENTCIKAGIMPDAWADDKTKVYTFSGQIFEEERPGGDILEKF